MNNYKIIYYICFNGNEWSLKKLNNIPIIIAFYQLNNINNQLIKLNMDPKLFVEKGQYDNFEIKAFNIEMYENDLKNKAPKIDTTVLSDDDEIDVINVNDDKYYTTTYYVPNGWLFMQSEYFKIMLTSGLSESQTNFIKLKHSPKIILTLLRCIHYLPKKGEEFIGDNLFKEMCNENDIYDFFDACEQYQFELLKNLFEKYCSTEEILISFFCTKLISTIQLFNLKIMKENLHDIIKKNPKMVESIKYKTMECKYINFFCPISWPIFVNVLLYWLKCHDPSDHELRNAGLYEYNYEKMPIQLCEKFGIEIRKLKYAKNFKGHIFEKIFCALYDEEEK